MARTLRTQQHQAVGPDWRRTGDREARAQAFVEGVVHAVQDHVIRKETQTRRRASRGPGRG